MGAAVAKSLTGRQINELLDDPGQLPIDQVDGGHRLGQRAKAFYVKTAEAMLQLSQTIHKAWSQYYAPFHPVGRPPVFNTTESNAASDEWKAFLIAAGFNMEQHAKLLRNYSYIGNQADTLLPYSANLPSSFETLAVLAKDPLPKRMMSKLLSKVTKDSTTAEVLRERKYLEKPLVKLLDDANPTELDNDLLESKPGIRQNFAVRVSNKHSNQINLCLLLFTDRFINRVRYRSKDPGFHRDPPSIKAFEQWYGKLAYRFQRMGNSEECKAFVALLEKMDEEIKEEAMKISSVKANAKSSRKFKQAAERVMKKRRKPAKKK